MSFFYHAVMRVDGLLWYHTVARTIASPKVYSHTLAPVIHNYGITLELAGYIVDPDVGFVSLFGHTSYKRPVDLYRRYGVYAYPAYATRPILSELFMSAIGESLVEDKKEGRLAYPETTKHTVLMPGSVLETLVVSEEKLPGSIVLRIGAKRYGVLSARLIRVNPRTLDAGVPSHPYNLADVVRVSGHVVLLSHRAGDIGIMGKAMGVYEYKVKLGSRQRRIIVPILEGVQSYDG